MANEASKAEAATAREAARAQPTTPRAKRKPAASRPAGAKAATPWGPAAVVDEVRVAQRAGEKRFASVVQLLEDGRGETLVRIAYTTDGVARRGPVTLRLKDLDRLRAAASERAELAAALGWAGGEA
jgi:hypothetical protein